MKDGRPDANVLSVEVIPNVDPTLAKELSLKPEHRSLGIVTSGCGDVTYVILDEAIKTADVTVVYGKSMYVGATSASIKLAGKVIGIIVGPNPTEINSGLSVITQAIKEEASFYNIDEDDDIVCFVHVVSGTGSLLFGQANIPEDGAIAYLTASPLETVVGLDVVMKTADVQMDVFYDLLSEANFGGALLAGSQSVCKVTYSAFKQVIRSIADNPLSY